MGLHFQQSHTRSQYHSAALKIPEMFSAPRSIAEKHNARRNLLISKGNEAHERAEKAWAARDRWNLGFLILTNVSAISFVVGVSLPLAHVGMGGSFAPPE